jgi:hypothetical protein
MFIATVGSIVDHLWQSLLVGALLLLFVRLTRRNSATVRLWLWRVAAAKLALPFAALTALGAAIGFPVTHVSDPPPALLVALIGRLAPWLSPARHLELEGWVLGGIGLALSLAAAALLQRALRAQRAAFGQQEEERLRRERCADDRPPGVGFLTSALMAACAMILVTAALLPGAIRSLQQRQAWLETDAAALRDATVTITPARGGMGSRSRVLVDADGVTIRNVTLRELTALAYGVGRFAVYGQHFYVPGSMDWLIAERHDVRITGRIRDVERFETYALRELLTRVLAERYGLEIYLNASCQPPCGKWGMPMP